MPPLTLAFKVPSTVTAPALMLPARIVALLAKRVAPAPYRLPSVIVPVVLLNKTLFGVALAFVKDPPKVRPLPVIFAVAPLAILSEAAGL